MRRRSPWDPSLDDGRLSRSIPTILKWFVKHWRCSSKETSTGRPRKEHASSTSMSVSAMHWFKWCPSSSKSLSSWQTKLMMRMISRFNIHIGINVATLRLSHAGRYWLTPVANEKSIYVLRGWYIAKWRVGWHQVVWMMGLHIDHRSLTRYSFDIHSKSRNIAFGSLSLVWGALL